MLLMLLGYVYRPLSVWAWSDTTSYSCSSKAFSRVMTSSPGFSASVSRCVWTCATEPSMTRWVIPAITGASVEISVDLCYRTLNVQVPWVVPARIELLLT